MTSFLRVIRLDSFFSIKCLTALLVMMLFHRVEAYPDFIAYGYRSCLTCHFNGAGGGALNDYGRAVWNSEMTSKALLNRNTSDEKMGENSGFLGKVQLPWWIRPGLKYRGIKIETDPGSGKSVDRWINMQQEANAAVFFDKDQKLMAYGSYGYRPTPAKYAGATGKKPEDWISREHYLRWQYRENLYLYAGSMDKVFGIKNVDHTAFGRTKTRTTMDDQTHGVMGHYINDKYDLFGHVFLGNLAQDEKLREKGFSLHYDRAIGEKESLGLSYISTKNDFLQKQALSLQYRLGLRNTGNGIMMEIGLVEDKEKALKVVRGYYTFLEGLIKLTRGYHLLTTYENWKSDISKESAESYRYGGGFLMFPWTRTELRVQMQNYRTMVPGQANPDTWVLTGQIHLSL